MEQRILKLERRCRALTLCLVSLGIIGLLLGAGGQTDFDLIRVKQLELVDANGNARATLMMMKGETAAFGMIDRKAGRTDYILSAGPQGVKQALFEGGIQRVTISAGRGDAVLSVSDNKGKPRVSSMAANDGVAYLSVFDASGDSTHSFKAGAGGKK